jgi:hypothetical protein
MAAFTLPVETRAAKETCPGEFAGGHKGNFIIQERCP